jgi:hypothetical protein
MDPLKIAALAALVSALAGLVSSIALALRELKSLCRAPRRSHQEISAILGRCDGSLRDRLSPMNERKTASKRRATWVSGN